MGRGTRRCAWNREAEWYNFGERSRGADIRTTGSRGHCSHTRAAGLHDDSCRARVVSTRPHCRRRLEQRAAVSKQTKARSGNESHKYACKRGARGDATMDSKQATATATAATSPRRWLGSRRWGGGSSWHLSIRRRRLIGGGACDVWAEWQYIALCGLGRCVLHPPGGSRCRLLRRLCRWVGRLGRRRAGPRICLGDFHVEVAIMQGDPLRDKNGLILHENQRGQARHS